MSSSAALGCGSSPEPNPWGPLPSPAGERFTSIAHSPPLLPHRPGRRLASRFGKQRSLVPRLVLGVSMQELEQSLADWAHNMKELRAMKAELAHCILTEDMMVLQEQVEHLHRQWEELCLRVSFLHNLFL